MAYKEYNCFPYDNDKSVAGKYPGYDFSGGGASLRNGVTYTNKPHFFAEHQLY